MPLLLVLCVFEGGILSKKQSLNFLILFQRLINPQTLLYAKIARAELNHQIRNAFARNIRTWILKRFALLREFIVYFVGIAKPLRTNADILCFLDSKFSITIPL